MDYQAEGRKRILCVFFASFAVKSFLPQKSQRIPKYRKVEQRLTRNTLSYCRTAGSAILSVSPLLSVTV